jgi:hypothetical protein
MTPEELTAAAAHSREAMRAIAHIAREGGTGGTTYVMTSAEDVPGLIAHIAGLQRVIDDQEARLLAQASVIGLMHPVVEYVSRGRSFVDVGPYPDAAARRALGALDRPAEPAQGGA